ncbi:MAG: amino acid adenylation domain-containing protein, partial [Gammaproteobacteria bacterium]|nr:amino acid adenylation domain-containing protein [Gammaproteobacteria bacterium]
CWLNEFEALLSQVTASPEVLLSELSLLSESSRRRQVTEWNATSHAYPAGSLLSLLSAGIAPDGAAEAVCMDGESMDYAELERRSNAFARYLVERGAGRGEIVGLHLERSPRLVVALLGILKSGAAYLPLDPAFPPERLEFMLEDSGARLLVSESSLAGRLSGFAGESVCLDEAAQAIAGCSDAALEDTVRADDLAYVIYTSGSTGKPKGVQVTHGNVVNFLHSMAREPGLKRSDRLLAVTTLSFDISVLEIFLPLSVGATVVVASQAAVVDGHRLLALLNEQAITVMQATPATWRLLLSSGWSGDTGLKVLCGGEALPRDLATELLSHGGEVWNMYGPTETTVWSTCYRLSDPDAPVLIGRPIDNTQVYVLDATMNPVPEGVYGELYIGGDGVTRGYLNRPRLTAERFVADPFAKDPSARLYRTGDLVRYRTNGLLEYGHRADNQVKVRGFRIELGEIESALSKHNGIGETAVIVREDQPGDQRLVAYFVPEDKTSTPAATELRKHLRKKLPDYMVPQHFMALDEIPKTPNNKIDRNALPAISSTNGKQHHEFVEPKTITEIKLASFWKDVLGIDAFGIDDDFFEVGGHSLLVTKIMMKIRNELSVEVSFQQMFEAPTIRQIGEIIDGQSDRTNPVTPIPYVDPADKVRLSYTQERIWYLQQLDPESSAYNIPFSWRVRGPLDISCLETAVSNIAARHDVLRTRFVLADDIPVQIVASDIDIEIECRSFEDVSSDRNLEDVRRFAQMDSRRAFDLEQGPLFRLAVVHLDSEDHFVTVCFHHTVFDGWSLDIFQRELSAEYSALIDDQAATLTKPGVQFRDYTHWQRCRFEAGHVAHQLDYWKEQLGGSLPVLELPVDHPRPAIHRYDGATIVRELSPAIVGALDELGKVEKSSRFMVLYAAFVLLLSRLSGQPEIIVGTPIANRDRPETADLIGFFANTLVLRMACPDDSSFRDIVANARKVCLGAYANQDVPFERLVEELNPDRNTSRPVLFQALLAFQDVPASDNVIQVGDLEFQSELVGGNAQADLSLWVKSSGQQVTVAFEYCQSLFDSATIECWLNEFEALLSQVTASPEVLLSELSLLSESSRRRQVTEWN